MSANQSNRMVQRRRQRRNQTTPTSGATGVGMAPVIRYSPDTVMVFARRGLDATFSVDPTGAIKLFTPPGSTGVAPIFFGTPVAEPGTAGIWACPFYFAQTLSSLASGTRFLNFWSEFQMRNATLQFQALNGDSYAASASGGGSILAEIVSSAYEGANVVPTSVELVEAMPNSTRQVLTLARPHNVRFRPRPLVTTSTGQDAALNRVTDLWVLGDTTYFGAWGWIRNVPQQIMGYPPYQIRISLNCDLACRRPF